MKKTILTLSALALGAALAFGIAACDNASSGGKTENGAASSAQAYAFSALSAGTLISAMDGGDAATAAKPLSRALSQSAVTDEETIARLNDHMMLVESILGEGAYSAKSETSDREEYAVKEVMSYKDMLGETVEYVLYYNETEKREHAKERGGRYEERGRFDDDDFDDFDDDDDDKIENEYRIEGVLVLGEAEYPVRGEKETESERGESEAETEFTVILDAEAGKYMTVEQSTESDRGEYEQEYTYSLYENGRLTEKTSLEYEEERGETEIELGMYDRETGSVTRFYFEEDNKGITVRVGDRSATQTYRVSIVENEDGTTSYQYEYAGGRMHCERH